MPLFKAPLRSLPPSWNKNIRQDSLTIRDSRGTTASSALPTNQAPRRPLPRRQPPEERVVLYDKNDGVGFGGRSRQYVNDAICSVSEVSRRFPLDRSTPSPSEGNVTANPDWACCRRVASYPKLDAGIRVDAFVQIRNLTSRTSAKGGESSHAMLPPVGGPHHRVRGNPGKSARSTTTPLDGFLT
jgi:hypothetical protein